MSVAGKSSERLGVEVGRRPSHLAPVRQGRGFRRILVCLDRSPLSEMCVPQAVSMARAFGSSITLLHVLEPPRDSAAPRNTPDPLGWELARQEAMGTLERFERVATESSRAAVDVRLDQGHPAERIASIAREIGADLIVLGSHGASGVTAWNLGSTAQQVIAVAPASVLIARSVSTSAEVKAGKILVPLDGSVRTESVLPTVARIASATEAEVVLVHVVQEPMPTAVLSSTEDLQLARELASRAEVGARRYLSGIKEMLARDVPAVRTVVLRSPDDRQSLVELAQAEGADLVVMSAHGSNCNPAKPHGSVSAHLLTNASVPLLVVQDLADDELPRAYGESEGGTVAPLRRSLTAEDV